MPNAVASQADRRCPDASQADRRCPYFRWRYWRLLFLLIGCISSPAWVGLLPVEARSGHQTRLSQLSPPVRYRPPVVAPIVDPFRPPTTPYGPGNRGIEYATTPGTPVQAAADGLVVFAGAVAGGLHVTVRHADGIRTTYSFLATIRVRQGQGVRGGDVVGLAGATLHIGARRGDTYIDPASLWGRVVAPPEVHLVPLDGYEGRSMSPAMAMAMAERQRLARGGVTAAERMGVAAVQGAAAGVR